MEAAKNAVSSFLGRDGQHHTDVDEIVNPAVTSETIKPHRHEETTQAVDREVHQDHYHTTVQPIAHREVLPEQHTHNLAPQIEKTISHGDVEQDKTRVSGELAQFQDISTTRETTQSTAAAPVVVGEHVHHHVHEVVQPVIHKETIQPEIVHTTIPIHEKHTAPSEHHGLSTLPMKTMEEMQKIGAKLTEPSQSHHEYEGHPRPYNAEYQEVRKPVDVNPAEHQGTHDPEKTGHFDTPGEGGLAAGAATGAAAAGTGGALASAGRQTAHGYHTTADSKPSYGRTAGGYLTGAGGRHGPQDETSAGYGNSSAMGSGVAGIAAVSAVQDLGRDHTRAGQNTDLGSTDVRAPLGDSGTHTAGTSLGGRADGNTVSGATDAATSQTDTAAREAGIGGRRASRHEMDRVEPRSGTEAETQPSRLEDDKEPTNLEGGAAKYDDSDKVQHASQIGEDPSLITSNEVKSGKLTGTGIDGSHSAVFGLTPDGHKHGETSKGQDFSQLPEDDGEKSKRDSGVGPDTSSRGAASEGVAEQMHDPRVAEKGHEGKASYGESDNKPGAGS